MTESIVLRVLKRELANVGDDLARAKYTQQRSPEWRSADGETIQQVVDCYQKQWDELRAAIVQEQSK